MPTRSPSSTGAEWAGDARSLEVALREAIDGEVRFDAGSRAVYSTDASNYRQVPIGVVVPRTEEDLLEAMRIAREHGAPVLARGGGTSLAGQCCNVAVVIDTSKYLNEILEVDADRRFARVQPGVILDQLRDEAEKKGLTFGPDPATHSRCTLGGMIGNNSCGVHSIMSGKTDANVRSLRVATRDGEVFETGPTSESELERIVAGDDQRARIYRELRAIRDEYGAEIRRRFPKIPRNVSGYNLEQLLPENGFNVARALVGTEGTCAMVLEATLDLVHSPAHRALIVLGFDDIYLAADTVPSIMESPLIGLEGIDGNLVRDMRRKNLYPEAADMLPEGDGWLLAEMGADSPEELAEMVKQFAARMRRKRKNRPSVAVFDKPDLARIVWRTRESALGVTAVVPGQPHAWEGWEDAAVRPDRLGSYLRALRDLMGEYGYRTNLYGHFGDGCVHTRINFDLESREGIRNFREFVERAAHIVVEHGGSLSGEHGDGQARAELLPIMFGEELIEAFRRFKSAWDPDWMMNPGKVVDPYPITSNLRLGADWNPWEPQTEFAYPIDEGSFASATLRCVGVGECRRLDGGTMCPSFMVTREEKHSTRGRARALFEMVKGEVIRDGWSSEEVRETLDLCLSCKGCRSDCPVGVDVATYKAEFLSHYYARKVRPRAAYSMGLIPIWARLGARAPRLVNELLSTTEPIARRLGGMAADREIPKFAETDLFRLAKTRSSPGTNGRERERVILWADTFNAYFRPERGLAALNALEALDFSPELSPEGLCCGRPFYDFGFLGLAKSHLRKILDSLETEIEAGTRFVGLEPSCVAVFRDELLNLFPDDSRAVRLAGSMMTFAELVEPKMPSNSDAAARHAIVQQHCHQKAVMGIGPDERLLGKMGIERLNGDFGCCGMAGAFGFDAKHYEVSEAIARRHLVPAVSASPEETLVVTDGFSCAEQVEQLTGRRTVHLAQLVEHAVTGRVTEAEELSERAGKTTRFRLGSLALVAATVAGGVVLAGLLRKRRKASRRKGSSRRASRR